MSALGWERLQFAFTITYHSLFPQLTIGAAYNGDEISRLSSMNATAGTARALARSVRDVISWRGQHCHVGDDGSALASLPRLRCGELPHERTQAETLRGGLEAPVHAVQVASCLPGPGAPHLPQR
jgi:hypothetical protein